MRVDTAVIIENGQTNFDEMWDISSLLITKRYFKDNNINEIPN